MLRRPVVPHGHAVRLPTEADLKFRHIGLADQIVQKHARARVRVLTEAHILRRVEVREVRREGVDEQHLLAGLGMRTHHRMLSVGKLRLQCKALLDGHRRAEARLDAMTCAQAGNLSLDVVRETPVRLDHIGPQHVAAHGRGFDAAEHGAELRAFAPRRVAVPRVFVLLVARIGTAVDAYKPRMVRIAAGHRVVLEIAKAAGERDVLGARDVLAVKEQHLVLEEQCANLCEQCVVARNVA